MVWKPRSDPNQQVADAWSKVQDGTDWALSTAEYAQLLTEPVLAGRTPAIDVFASSSNTKVPKAFYSKFMCPGSLGVNAMLHPWALCDQQGKRLLAYINGPFHCMGQIVSKIRSERVDCILIAPAWPKHWVAMLYTLPIKHALQLPTIPDLFTPGPDAGTNAPKGYKAIAWFILWS